MQFEDNGSGVLVPSSSEVEVPDGSIPSPEFVRVAEHSIIPAAQLLKEPQGRFEKDGKIYRRVYMQGRPLVSQICMGTTKDGGVCQRAASKGSDYCKMHQDILKITGITNPETDAKTFIFKYAKTLDPHDSKHPVKNFPQWTFMEKMIDEWLANPLVLVVKSRQMMASWLFVALHTWDAIFHKGRSIFFVSKKEEDAGFGNQLSLLSRSLFIIENLPAKLQPKFHKSKRPPAIEFPNLYSSIMACSQEAEALRQYTASRILSDEMAFQEQAETAYTAMKPTIDGGGNLTGISTPNGRRNLFYYLSNDVKSDEKVKKIDEDGQAPGQLLRNEELTKGLTVRKNRNGFTVMSLHYSACPRKNEEWQKQAKKSYVSEDSWQQEQELNFSKVEGSRVYPGFKVSVHVKKQTFNPYLDVWRCWDFGYGHPACVWMQIDKDDRVHVLRELLGEEITIKDFGREVQRISDKYYMGVTFKDAGDPAGQARTDKSERTTVEILRAMGIRMRMRGSGVLEGINCIRGMLLKRADDSTGLEVDPSCEILIDGFTGGYVRKELDDEPVKDGFYEHMMDAFRYGIVVNFDPRTHRTFRVSQVFIPKRPFIDPVTGG
jgi:hypothetical protein